MVRALIGVDGCKGGWLCVANRADSFEAWISIDIESIVMRAGLPALIGIDVPIGFAQSTRRACDTEARALLRGRACTVFSPPLRAALSADTFVDACRINREIRDKGISKQTFALYPKLREVDRFVSSRIELRDALLEVHPEVSFALWSGRPMQHKKRSAQGRADRAALIEGLWPGLIEQSRAQLSQGRYAIDDLLDAIAALWSTLRYAKGRHRAFPETPELDELKLRIQIIG
jgi:predicted RNase H-like nuclease